MTQQEEQLLKGLIDRVNGTQLASKDAEAEALLQRSLGANPDALYILCQTVLVQGFAMDKGQRDLAAARAEIDSLKQAQPEKHGSFLGNLFGLGKDDEPQQSQTPQRTDPAPNYSAPTGYGTPTSTPGYAPVTNAPAVPQQSYPGQPSYGQPGYAQPGYPPYGYPPQGSAPGYGGQPAGGFGGGGFLQGAMQTAAGVVAGEFAFRAIEDVFSGFGHGERGFGGTEVVNNYYDDDRRDDSGGGGFGDRLAEADNYDGGISSDIEDRRGESRGFFGSADDSGNDGSNFADDSGSFDSSSDDDGGSFDTGDSSNDDSGY